jgi:dihydroorotase
MDLVITNARLIDPQAQTDSIGFVAVTTGRIAATGTGPAPQAAQTLDAGGKCLAPGLVDFGVKVCEPGERHKESFRTAGLAAAAGGVTTMITRPDTAPTIDNPETLEFVTRRAAEAAPVRIAHMSALTRGCAGQEMVEIGFMQDAGAVAFGDGPNVVRNPKVMARCLTYTRGLDALVVGHPQEPTFSHGAAATSGKLASLKGLPAVHPMAERMGLERDLALVQMTGGIYHADALSTAASLPALTRARDAGLNVTAGVDIHHLTLNELDIDGYRTFFKITPPLRAEDDRQAMIDAVANGTIDMICSLHTPQDEESKRLPFEEAASGAVALQTLLPAALRLYHAGALTLPQLFRAMSLNPAQRLGLPGGRLAVDAPADLILFDPDAPFVLDRTTLQSKSKNTPFDGQRMQGKVIKTFVGGNCVWGNDA